MLRTLRLAAVLTASSLLATGLNAQDAAINATGFAGAASALLDVDASSISFATKRGVLIPRMTNTERVAIAAPANGLWVFQTNDAAGSPHGFWYYDSGIPAWVHQPYGVAWGLAGNVGTIAGTHFLGTTDNDTLNFRTQNIQRMTILNTGQVGINTTTPVEAVEVNGAVRTYNTVSNSLSTAAGVIRYNTTPPAGTTNTYHEGYTGTAWERIENAEQRVINQPYAGSTLMCGNGTATASPTMAQPAASAALTPFPTGPGRCAKVQYIFRASELDAYGLCAGDITQIEFRILGDDPLAPSPCFLNFEVTMKSDATVPNTIATLDPALSAQAPNYVSPSLVIGAGWLVCPLSIPCNWNGVNNLIIEVCWTRNTVSGTSPQVELTNMGYNCVRYMYKNLPCLGCTDMNDSPPPPASTTMGLETRRPVVRFTGQADVPVPVLANWDYVLYTGGLMIGTPAWASTPGNFKGPGTICAEVAVFDSLTQLSDHVFDRYFDGTIRDEDRAAASTYRRVELDEMKEFLRTNRHLPNLPSRQEWNGSGPLSLGELGTRLWQTVEDQALYIMELEKDLDAMEGTLFREDLTDTELNTVIQGIQDNERLSAQDRAKLVETVKKQQVRTTNDR